MAADNDRDGKHIEKKVPYATVPERPEAPKAGPSTKGDNIQPQKMEKITEDVPTTPTFPWKWPYENDLRKEFVETYMEGKDDALQRTLKVVKQYSDEMVKRWNEEIDNLLVYAGLFSAILTAFNVQSYLLLQPSAPDPSFLVLQQISQQLNSFSVTQTGAFINSIHPVSFAPVQASPVEPWAVWLNSLWFSGLIFSLASASTGIMVKQWIHEYQAGISGDSLEIARLRQYRLNHLEKWHVAEIVAFLPVLLQIALFLFFSGLLILLWHYHSTVAIVASILIGVVALFVVGTTVIPLIWRDCCYLSPPVYLLFNFAQHVKVGLGWLRISISWTVAFLLELLLGDPAQMLSVSELSNDLKRSTWRGREQVAVQSTSSTLDVDMTLHAYSTTIDIKHLSDAGAILAIHGVDAIHKYYTEVQNINEQHFGQKNIDIEVPLAEVWASQLFYSIREEDNVDALWVQSKSYRDSLSPSMYNRLLLALAAAVSKSDVASRVPVYSLHLLEELFTFNPDALKLMPWNAVHHVAGAMETQLRRLLRPLDDEHGQEADWHDVFRVLRILVRCCFVPVSSWERSPEDMRVCMQYILGQDFLQKQSLRENASKADDFISLQIMHALTLILTYLGESVDAWGCRPAVEEFMEAVGTVISIIEPKNISSIKSELQQLKISFRQCESCLAKQVASLQPAENGQGAPEITASGTD